MGKTASGSARLHFPNRLSVLALVLIFLIWADARVSQFVSMLLLAIALTLTLCFGVAAWRQSTGGDINITATIPHHEYGWRATPSN
jgi:Flp pilus assembly protein protease CpaA